MKELINKVRKKPCTGMRDFWISYMEMMGPLIQNIDACHAQNGFEYLSSKYNMLPVLMAYDNYDYGRWFKFFGRCSFHFQIKNGLHFA